MFGNLLNQASGFVGGGGGGGGGGASNFLGQAAGMLAGGGGSGGGGGGGAGGMFSQAAGFLSGGGGRPSGGGGGYAQMAQGAFSSDPYNDFGPSDYQRPDPYDSQFGPQDFGSELPPSARILNGNRKALCIGINYPGSNAPLRGCVNDANMMASFLSQHGFRDITLMTDEPHNNGSPLYPTRANMLAQMNALVANAAAGDSLFLHYSGHGSQEHDAEGDEEDRMDETLIPCDYQRAGMLSDDVLHRVLLSSLPRGCRLTVILDCCHSGTALDLPFTFIANDRAMSNWWTDIPSMFTNPRFDLRTAVKFAKVGYQLYRMAQGRGGGGGGGGILGIGGGGADSGHGYQAAGGEKAVAGEVIMFSGCADAQTSADVGNVQAVFSLNPGPGGSGGACTSAFVSSFNEKAEWSLVELLDSMRQKLKQRGFEQVPQLSSSRKLSLKSQWSLDRLMA